jgi:hypothetical protein
MMRVERIVGLGLFFLAACSGSPDEGVAEHAEPTSVSLFAVGANPTTVAISTATRVPQSLCSGQPAGSAVTAMPALPAGATWSMRFLSNQCLILVHPMDNIRRRYLVTFPLNRGTGVTIFVAPNSGFAVNCGVQLERPGSSVVPPAGPVSCPVAQGGTCTIPGENMDLTQDYCFTHAPDLLTLAPATPPTPNPSACAFASSSAGIGYDLKGGVGYRYSCPAGSTYTIGRDPSSGGPFYPVFLHRLLYTSPSSASCQIVQKDLNTGASVALTGILHGSGLLDVSVSTSVACHTLQFQLQCGPAAVFFDTPVTANDCPGGFMGTCNGSTSSC